MAANNIWTITKETVTEWQEDKALRLGAALAYYTTFSIAPLLIIVIGIASLVFGSESAQPRIMSQLTQLVGASGAEAMGQMLQHQSHQPGGGLIPTLVGFVVLLFGASGVVVQLQDALNTIFEVAPKSGSGIWSMVRLRVLAFAMVLGVGFLLLVSLVISAAITAVASSIASPLVLRAADMFISLAVITLLFALIFRFLPDAEVRWKNVWTGGFVTAVLFVIGKTLIGLYFSKSAVASGFGAASSLVLLLVWVYYNSQILFLGAEFTMAYSRSRGEQPRPKPHAEWLSAQHRIQQGLSPKTASAIRPKAS